MNTEVDLNNNRESNLFSPFIDTDSPESSELRNRFQIRVENEVGDYSELSLAQRMQRINTTLNEEIPSIKDTDPVSLRTHGITISGIRVEPERGEISRRLGFNSEYKQTAKNGLAQVVDKINEQLDQSAPETDDIKTLAKRTRLANIVYNVMTLNQPYTDLNKQRARLLAFSYIPLPKYKVQEIPSAPFDIITEGKIDSQVSRIEPVSEDLLKLQKLTNIVEHYLSQDNLSDELRREAIQILVDIPDTDTSQLSEMNNPDLVAEIEGLMRITSRVVRMNTSNLAPYDLTRLTRDLEQKDQSGVRSYVLDYLASPQGERFLISYVNGEKKKPENYVDKTEEQIQDALRGLFRRTFPLLRNSFKQSSIENIAAKLAPDIYQTFPFSEEFLVDPANQERGEELFMMKGRSKEEKGNMKKRIVYYASISDAALRNPLILNLRNAKQTDKIYTMLNTEYEHVINFCGADPLMYDCLSIVNARNTPKDTIVQLRERLKSEGIEIEDENAEFKSKHVLTNLQDGKWTATMDQHATMSVLEHLKAIFRIAYEKKIQQRHNLQNKQEIKTAIFTDVPEMPIQEIIADQLLDVLVRFKIDNSDSITYKD